MSEQGDRGYTDLPFEKGVPKHDGRIRALAALDEMMAFLGLVRAELGITAEAAGVVDIAADINQIQRQLVTVSAHVAGFAKPESVDQFSGWLERRATELDARLEPLREFILPGVNRTEGFLHCARAKCRECETRVADLQDCEPVIKYVNRLAKYLFNAGRIVAGKA
ncbi:MAG: ATP:cob(I)alamin adenosyltransferase [Elusimicrobiaceae bacterium]|nr:ATP:cob(I)alamin adenosyltransferase [Elusimicrobiaceae bacterium]